MQVKRMAGSFFHLTCRDDRDVMFPSTESHSSFICEVSCLSVFPYLRLVLNHK